MSDVAPNTGLLGPTLGTGLDMLRRSWPWLAAWAGVEFAFSYVSPANAGVWFSGAAALIRTFALAAWLSAMYRSTGLGPEDDNPFSGTLRTFGASLLVMLALGLTAFFLFLFMMIFGLIMVAVSGYDPTQGDPTDSAASIAALRQSGSIWLVYGVGLAGLSGLAWMAFRLFLYAAATLDRGKILVFQTWAWTRGLWKSHGSVSLMLVGVPLVLGTVLSPWLAGLLGLDQTRAIHLVHILLTAPAILFWTAMAAVTYRELAPASAPDAGASS